MKQDGNLSDVGDMLKTTDINQSGPHDEGGVINQSCSLVDTGEEIMIKAGEINQSGPHDGGEVSMIKEINQSDDGEEIMVNR